jgi:hypothetical protein
VSEENLQLADEATTERLNETDLAWYKFIMAQAQAARTSANALEQTTSAMLSQKYQLKQGDSITDNGEIKRA